MQSHIYTVEYMFVMLGCNVLGATIVTAQQLSAEALISVLGCISMSHPPPAAAVIYAHFWPGTCHMFISHA